MNEKEYIYEYKILSIQPISSKETLVNVSLHSKDEYKIILKIGESVINNIFPERVPSADEKRGKLRELLSKDNNLLLIRIVRIALGNEKIKKQLREGLDGQFSIDYTRWQTITNKIKEEELEEILAQGLSEEENTIIDD